MMKQISRIILICVLFSCKYENKQINLTSKDTVLILNKVLYSKEFFKENSANDTVFFLKSKYYNNAYPSRVNNYNIKYIENSEKNRMMNKINQSDKRLRLDIVNFKYKNDTVSLYMVDCGVNTGYDFRLIQNKGIWKIIKTDITMY